MDFTIAIAQVNPHVGALEANVAKMLSFASRAREAGAQLVLFPELAISGYPPEDLLLKPLFLDALIGAESRLLAGLAEIGIDAVYGAARQVAGGLRNVAVFACGGEETGLVGKWRLPNYGVFDEQRYFLPFREIRTFAYRGLTLGFTICEDVWREGDPLAGLAQSGAELILNLNASPYHLRKFREREATLRARVLETGLPIVYANQVGGQDELVFDGGSFVMDQQGVVIARAAFFREDLLLLPVHRLPEGGCRLEPQEVPPLPPVEREVHDALCLGLADYVRKNGFDGVVLGLSGGVDSALTAVLCVDALGPERVELFMLPSRFTSLESLEDAQSVAERLGVPLRRISIDALFSLFKQELAEEFAGLPEGVAEENLQPRIRATLLMAVSNKRRKLLVSTGNKSEGSVGYATLYGDMAGGFSVLKDLLKGWVYRISRACNQWAEAEGRLPPMVDRILDKAPTAELKEDQKDSDTLPPYPILDEILHLYVEEEYSLAQIVARGLDKAVVERVLAMVDANEYKRRQASPGVKITPRAFGRDRRYPITNGFKVR